MLWAAMLNYHKEAKVEQVHKIKVVICYYYGRGQNDA